MLPCSVPVRFELTRAAGDGAGFGVAVAGGTGVAVGTGELVAVDAGKTVRVTWVVWTTGPQ